MLDCNGALGFCAILAVILGSTKFFGLCFRHFGLPEVLGFIIAGILIGPAVFGDLCGFSLIGFTDRVEEGAYVCLFALDRENALAVFSKIGVLLLMFSTGLETDLHKLKSTGVAALVMAFAGVAVPLLLGFLISLPFGNIGLGIASAENIFRCVFIGTILTATSVAITVSVLKELGKINTKLGTTIISAAIIDDVIGIILLSVVTSIAKGMSGTGEENVNAFEAFKTTPYGTVIMILCFFVFAIGVGFLLSKGFKWLDKRWPATHRIPVFSLAVCFGYSWIAEEVFGVADITGAFLAGVVLSTVHRASEYTDRQVEVNTYTIFAPAFFANIGISTISFIGFNPAVLLFAFAAVAVGLLGKVLGCGAVCKAFKFGTRESLIGGVGMMARGEVALIVTSAVTSASLGAYALPPEFMIMTVFLILLSSVFTPVLLKVLYGGKKAAQAVEGGAIPAEAAGSAPSAVQEPAEPAQKADGEQGENSSADGDGN